MKRLLAMLICLLMPFALAEGSRDLLGSATGEYRAFLESGYGNTKYAAIIPRKTTLYAYVSSNTERIAVGSSALTVTGTSDAAIIITPLISGGTQTKYTNANACGQITSRNQESLGPSTVYSGGYVPCTYTPTSGAGLYQVDIMAPSATNNTVNPTPVAVASAWATPAAGDCCVAAWDVSVISGTAEQKGRVFAKYMSLNTGGNTTPIINLKVNVQTRDGYLYNVVQKLDPYGYIFFANNKGVLSGGNPTYQSSAGATSLPFHLPTDPDDTTNYTAKLFFNAPSSALPASVTTSLSATPEWLLPSTTILPPTPNTLIFTGKNGTPGYAGSQSGNLLGGTFTFNNPGAAGFAYRLTIPLSANGTGSTDRVFLGTSVAGSNSVVWDGLDGSGNPVPATSYNYTATIKLYSGELHFPLLDVENSNGLIITRVNPPVPSYGGADGGASYVYWNDTPIVATTGAPTPKSNLNGTSTTPAHTWSSAFGNDNTIDTWVYYPSSTTTGNGLTVRSADIRVVKTSTATAAPLGYDVVYNLAFTNLTAPGTACPGQTTCTVLVTATDPLPAGFTAMSWTCASGCAATSGTGALNTVVTLVDGNTVNVKVTGTLSTTAGTSVSNTANVTSANDATDPATANNTSTLTLNTRAAIGALTLAKAQRLYTTGTSSPFVTTGIQVRPKDQVQYQLTFTNTGDKGVKVATVRDTLPAQLTPVGNATITCPNGTTGSITPAGQLISADVVPTCGIIKAGESGTVTILTTVK